jgi:hypothetical protein
VKELDHLRQKHAELDHLLADYASAKETATRHEEMLSRGQILCLDQLKLNPVLFCYYTGLPSYSVFTALFNYFQPLASDMQYVSQAGKLHHAEKFARKPGKDRTLSLENEFFATLVRLRLGLPSKDCARRFGISESVFSVIFNTWVILLAQQLELLCQMPSSQKTSEYQAACFDNFSNVRIVLDCTEVFSQTPGALETHKQVHSNYKHHSTIKFLVGMSPSGAIIYVSDMWGGRASDKKITQESFKLLSSLDAGNKVMVDRGFTIAEDLPPGVQLLIPPFKNKCTGQLSKEQLEYSEKISVARIHIERAMRAIKEHLCIVII